MYAGINRPSPYFSMELFPKNESKHISKIPTPLTDKFRLSYCGELLHSHEHLEKELHLSNEALKLANQTIQDLFAVKR